MNIDPIVSISIISHGHREHLIHLLRDITRSIDVPYEILLTFNIAEDSSFLAEFKDKPIHILKNESPKGFGANHNAAFLCSKAPYFIVLNPDIRGYPFNIGALLEVFSIPNTAISVPIILNSRGQIQDSIRPFPTPLKLLARKLGIQPKLEHDTDSPHTIDWAAGMFLVFKRESYQQLGGFDERYFMYVEDVDICWRAKQAGLTAQVSPQCRFTHDGQYQSRKNLRHFFWHLKSYCIFFAKYYRLLRIEASPKRLSIPSRRP